MSGMQSKSVCGTTASAFPPTSGTSCSSHSSPPNRLARAPALAYRSPTTSSRSSMAAPLQWTARSANTASSRYVYRVARKRVGERSVLCGARLVPGGFAASVVPEFVRDVCSWGGYAGIGGRVMKRNEVGDIAEALREAHGLALQNHPAKAV